MANEVGKSLVDNVMLTLIARAAMLLAIPAFGLITYLVNDRFEVRMINQEKALIIALETQKESFQTALQNQQSQYQGQQTMLLNQITELNRSLANAHSNATQNKGRIDVLESQRASESVRLAAFESTMTQRYDRVQDALIQLSNQVSALAAIFRSDSKQGQNRLGTSNGGQAG